MTEKLSAFDLETFMSKLVDALPKLAGAVIIIALGFWVSSLIGKLLIKGCLLYTSPSPRDTR